MQNKKGKALLIVMPLHDVLHCNLASSILKTAVVQKGFECDVRYANLEFANKIGQEYHDELIKGKTPFLSDIIFSASLNDKQENEFEGDELINLVINATDFIKSTARDIVSEDYEIIGFNLNYHTVPSLALAKEVKLLNPNVKVVLGGSNCEGEMGIALHEAFPFIDFVCLGEGEKLIAELFSSIYNNANVYSHINNLVYRNDRGESKVNLGLNIDLIKLEDIPTANFDDWFIQLKHQSFFFKRESLILPYESSRGCWHGAKQKCIFCGLCGSKINYRVKNADLVEEQINSLHSKYGVSRFFAMDLVFPNEYFKSFLPKNKGKKYGYGYEIRADITKDRLRKLREGNVFFALSGIESLDSEMLSLLRKGTKAYQNIRLLKWAFVYGLNMQWFILHSLPGENNNIYKRMIERIPSLMHLPPPKGFEEIVIHRFSPMYDERESLGLKNVRPNEAYHKFYNLPEEQLNKLAYYFEHDYEPPQEVELLRAAVTDWKSSYPSQVFFSIEFKDKLYFYDSRRIAKNEVTFIEKNKKQVYLLCDSGATMVELIDKSGLKQDELNAHVQDLLNKNLIIEIDNRYLSLAVEMDPSLIKIEDINLALPFYAQIYRTWAKEMQKFII